MFPENNQKYKVILIGESLEEALLFPVLTLIIA